MMKKTLLTKWLLNFVLVSTSTLANDSWIDDMTEMEFVYIAARHAARIPMIRDKDNPILSRIPPALKHDETRGGELTSMGLR